ncbi:MAG: CsgG/HfaB family protein [Armatimonadia bacterium]
MKNKSLVLVCLLLMVSMPVLAQDAGMPKFPEAKIMIVVPEFHKGTFALLERDLLSQATWIIEGYSAGLPSVETQLIKQFVDANYKVVDQNQYASQRYTPEMEQVLKDPTGPAARSLTANVGADVLIVGKATSEIAGTVNNTTSVRTILTLRAVTTKGDALIIGATDATGSGADISGDAASLIASRKAADIAAKYLVPKVGNTLGGPTTNEALTAMANASSGKTRIAVMPFEDKSQWAMADWNLGMQIPDLIANELMKISSYEIVDRANLGQVINQQGLQQSGLFDSEGKAEELGTLAKADYGVFGRITEFTTKTRGGLLGVRGLGVGLGSEQAIVNILIKIVDLKTGVVMSTCEARADATEAVLGGGYVGMVFGGASFDKSAAGRATRKAIGASAKAVMAALPAKCPQCGAKVNGDDKFCGECGAGLEAVALTCAKCKASLKAGAKFCGKCGQKVQQ